MPRARTRAGRLASVFTGISGALLLGACSSGGGGGSEVLGPGTAAGSSSVTLAWNEADGPVEGYSVFVQRGNGAFQQEADVFGPQVTVNGEPGTTARVVVVAFDSDENTGPSSPPSQRFTFPEPAAGMTAAAGSGQKGSRQKSASGSSTTPAHALATSGGASAEESASAASGGPGDDPEVALAADSSHLVGALLWQAGDALRVTNAELETTQLFSRPGPGLVLATVGDFDGDGAGDLLWSDAAGHLAFTSAAALAAAPAETPLHDFGLLEVGERVVAAGDFDGDGIDDLVVQRADDSVHVWYTLPGDVVETSHVGSARGAALVGVGDFDGNGIGDLAWSLGGSTLALWLLDGVGTQASVEVALEGGLEITGSGDFDGDGVAEVTVRDAQGDVFVMQPLADPAAIRATDLAGAGSWHWAGATDLDRDGNDDLVLLGEGALRTAYLPGDQVRPLDPASPWSLVALLP